MRYTVNTPQIAVNFWEEAFLSLQMQGSGEHTTTMADTTKADILKKEILAQYKSVRQFSIEMNIPYSTLVTALDRGIEGMAYGTVIRICDRLSLNPVDFTPLDQGANLGDTIIENRVMQQYLQLNKTARDKVLEIMGDFLLLDKYRNNEE